MLTKRYIWWSLIFVVAIVLVVMEALNKSPSFWLTQKLLGYKTKYIEHDISLTVSGRSVEVRGTIECIPYNVSDIGNLTQLRYVEEQQSINRRFDNGRTLIIIVPNLCYEHVGTVADDLRPILGLLDARSRPSVLQLFIVPDSPAARSSAIQLISMRSTVSETAPQTDSDAPTLQWRTRTKELTTYNNRFPENALALFGWRATRAELARAYGLPQLPGESEIDDIAAKDPAGVKLEAIFPDRYSRIYRGLEGDIRAPIISSPLSELETERRIIPFRLAQGMFVPSPDDRGTLLFFLEPFAIGADSRSTDISLQRLLEQLDRGPRANRGALIKDYLDLDRDAIVFATTWVIGSISERDGGQR